MVSSFNRILIKIQSKNLELIMLYFYGKQTHELYNDYFLFGLFANKNLNRLVSIKTPELLKKILEQSWMDS